MSTDSPILVFHKADACFALRLSPFVVHRFVIASDPSG